MTSLLPTYLQYYSMHLLLNAPYSHAPNYSSHPSCSYSEPSSSSGLLAPQMLLLLLLSTLLNLLTAPTPAAAPDPTLISPQDPN